MHRQFRIQSKQCNELQKVAKLIQDNHNKKIDSVEQHNLGNIKSIDLLYKTLDQLKSQINQQIDQLIENTNEWIKYLKEIGQKYIKYSFFDQLDNLINQNKLRELDYSTLNTEINTINNSWSQNIITQLNQFKQFELTKTCEKQLTNLNSIIQQPFNMNQLGINKFNRMNAIAINNNNSIVLAGCDNTIKVFEFKQEFLKLIQLLTEHQQNVYTLNFMKKSTQFISRSRDNQIIIQCMVQENQWICQQKLNEHQSQINCLLLNNDEELISSGSDDKKIKFWTKKNELACSFTNTDSKNQVQGLSLNEKQNRVYLVNMKCFLYQQQSNNKIKNGI
ncbi:unnamed protein product [Paramecium octaurelia]|uniref:WD domain, G-beta repeat protein n=1 Tax=Paramecium octaurelia TaxID=43137 RepID=A0A8S1YBS7_PAROT|nr:unnamed protein product [Paramecium octaurelia]